MLTTVQRFSPIVQKILLTHEPISIQVETIPNLLLVDVDVNRQQWSSEKKKEKNYNALVLSRVRRSGSAMLRLTKSFLSGHASSSMQMQPVLYVIICGLRFLDDIFTPNVSYVLKSFVDGVDSWH